jgi:hypothetical protein
MRNSRPGPRSIPKVLVAGAIFILGTVCTACMADASSHDVRAGAATEYMIGMAVILTLAGTYASTQLSENDDQESDRQGDL